MRKTICACVFMLALCGSAFAGDTETPPIVVDDNTTGSTTIVATDPNSPGTTLSPDDQITYGLTEAALTVLNNVLALL